MERWRERLIDFSRRNSLLYFRGSRSTRLRIAAPEPAELYEALVLREKVLAFPVPAQIDVEDAAWGLTDPAAPSNAPREERLRERPGDLTVDYDASSAKDVVQLQQKLLRLMKNQRQVEEERGINTLHLGLGLLAWSEHEAQTETQLAPLVLIKVRLQRPQQRAPFQLLAEEPDPRLNPTLAAYLSQAFQVSLPAFDERYNGLGDREARLYGYFDAVARSVHDLDFRVQTDAWLSHFQFEKLVMWEDLGDPDTVDAVCRHPVLSAVVGAQEYESKEVPDELRAPEAFEDPDTYPVLDADSSQVEVLARIRAGNSVVVEGPPGTGKSQTIVNTIAQALSEGKTVLFVSQKRAALEVVHRRLQERRLAHLCLELHSHQSRRADVVGRLAEELDRVAGPAPGGRARRRFERRRELRGALDEYVRDLHRPRGAAGYDAYRINGELVRLRDVPEVTLAYPREVLELTREEEDRLVDLVADVAQSEVWDAAPHHAWRGAVVEDPLPVVRRELSERLRELADACAETRSVREDLVGALGSLGAPRSVAELPTCGAMLDHLRKPPFLLAAHWIVADDGTAGAWSDVVERGSELLDALAAALRVLEEHDARPIVGRPDEAAGLLRRYRHDYARRWQRLTRAYRRDRRRLREIVGRKLPYVQALQVLVAAGRVSELLQALADLAPTVRKAAGEQIMGAAASVEPALWVALPDLPTDRRWWTDLSSGLLWARKLRSLLLRANPEQADDGGTGSADRLTETAQRVERLHQQGDLVPTAEALEVRLHSAAERMGTALQPIALLFPQGVDGLSLEALPLDELEELTRGWLNHLDELADWRRYQLADRAAREAGLGPFLDAARERGVSAAQLRDAFIKALRLNWVSEVFRSDPSLGRFDGRNHERLIDEFRRLDRELFDEAARYVAAAVYERQEPVRTALAYLGVRGRPAASRPDNDDQIRQLKEQIRRLQAERRKKRRHMPVRQFLPAVADLLRYLTPCVLASPLSVATYLPRGRFRFDLVIIDEASQVLPEDAVGALLRGDQAVVFGDSKQMPPTPFFQRVLDDDTPDPLEGDGEPDAPSPEDVTAFESILDLMGGKVPTEWLRWHYRSRDERLIAFSNQRFYAEKPLITFPAPYRRASDRGVRLLVVDGRYEPGTRINLPEAEAVVALILEHLRERPDRTLGVIALGLPQAEIIERLLHRRVSGDPRLAWIVEGSDGTGEPFFIKNLENVQGDERDEIIISVGYGPTVPGGRVPLRFGPINQVGGERRLNVAITRARLRTTVVASFTPDALARTAEVRNEGPRLLYEYLLYCQREGELVPSPELDPARIPESPFEEEVLAALNAAGYQVDPQVGASHFRIDLAVRDPDDPLRYLVGIECDGATYHSSAAARDRDRLRQEILEELGWRIIRVWSTDWINDPQRQLGRLIEQIESARRSRRN